MSKKPYRIIFDDILPEITTAEQNKRPIGYEEPYDTSPISSNNEFYKDQISPNLLIKNIDKDPGGISVKNGSGFSETTISSAEIADIVSKTISNLRVYVLESDITDAHNSVKSVVDLASF